MKVCSRVAQTHNTLKIIVNKFTEDIIKNSSQNESLPVTHAKVWCPLYRIPADLATLNKI